MGAKPCCFLGLGSVFWSWVWEEEQHVVDAATHFMVARKQKIGRG
jgi:hypothetical protein